MNHYGYNTIDMNMASLRDMTHFLRSSARALLEGAPMEQSQMNEELQTMVADLVSALREYSTGGSPELQNHPPRVAQAPSPYGQTSSRYGSPQPRSPDSRLYSPVSTQQATERHSANNMEYSITSHHGRASRRSAQAQPIRIPAPPAPRAHAPPTTFSPHRPIAAPTTPLLSSPRPQVMSTRAQAVATLDGSDVTGAPNRFAYVYVHALGGDSPSEKINNLHSWFRCAAADPIFAGTQPVLDRTSYIIPFASAALATRATEDFRKRHPFQWYRDRPSRKRLDPVVQGKVFIGLPGTTTTFLEISRIPGRAVDEIWGVIEQEYPDIAALVCDDTRDDLLMTRHVVDNRSCNQVLSIPIDYEYRVARRIIHQAVPGGVHGYALGGKQWSVTFNVNSLECREY